jgi:hypothetical protein
LAPLALSYWFVTHAKIQNNKKQNLPARIIGASPCFLSGVAVAWIIGHIIRPPAERKQNKTPSPYPRNQRGEEKQRERGGIKQRKEIEISSNQGEKKQSSTTTTTMVSVSAAASI